MTSSSNQEFSFKKYAWRQFKKNKPAYISFNILIFLVIIASTAHFLANDQPLYAKYRGRIFFPAFQTYFNSSKTDSTINPETGKWEKLQFDITDWKQLDLEGSLFAPIIFSPEKPDRYNRDYVSPSDDNYYKNSKGKIVKSKKWFKHHLGTDAIGRDVFSGIIHATKISLTIGLISMGIATVIGLILGGLAGFYGDKRLFTTRMTYYMTIIGIILGFFYAFIARNLIITQALENSMLHGWFEILLSLIILILVIFVFNFLGKKLSIGRFLSKKVTVPVDSYVSRTIEILNSMPRLLLIITITAIFERSMFLLMAIIGVTSWTGIARLIRAELLKIRDLEYIQASNSLGYSNRRIIFKHALPNGLAPVFVTIAFGIASAILIESGLSFLGIGVPDQVVTWGSLLSLGRQEFEAWWLVVFPGLAIFVTITIYNLIGEGLRDALDPKLKQ